MTDFITNKGTSELSGKNIEDKLKIRLQSLANIKGKKEAFQKDKMKIRN